MLKNGQIQTITKISQISIESGQNDFKMTFSFTSRFLVIEDHLKTAKSPEIVLLKSILAKSDLFLSQNFFQYPYLTENNYSM